jgi:hypothetical protein
MGKPAAQVIAENDKLVSDQNNKLNEIRNKFQECDIRVKQVDQQNKENDEMQSKLNTLKQDKSAEPCKELEAEKSKKKVEGFKTVSKVKRFRKSVNLEYTILLLIVIGATLYYFLEMSKKQKKL